MKSQFPSQSLHVYEMCVINCLSSAPSAGPKHACLSVFTQACDVHTNPGRSHQPDRSHPVPQLANGIGCDIMQKTEVCTYTAASSMARWSLFQAAVALIKSQLTQKTSEVKSP